MLTVLFHARPRKHNLKLITRCCKKIGLRDMLRNFNLSFKIRNSLMLTMTCQFVGVLYVGTWLLFHWKKMMHTCFWSVWQNCSIILSLSRPGTQFFFLWTALHTCKYLDWEIVSDPAPSSIVAGELDSNSEDHAGQKLDGSPRPTRNKRSPKWLAGHERAR